MKAIDRFERLNVQTTTMFPGQDSLKNHILNKADILYVDNPTDFSVLETYTGNSKFVWLVDKNIITYASFPWYYKPSNNSIYKFPYVFDKSRKVKTFDSVVLVPIDAHTVEYEVVHENYIAGHYDPYNGKDKFDIFYIGKDKT